MSNCHDSNLPFYSNWSEVGVSRHIGTGGAAGNLIAQLVPGVGGFIAGNAASFATANALYGAYTRPQERGADELGLKWMVAAGYDPSGMERLFDVLGKHGSGLPGFLSTHPGAEDRAQMVRAFINAHGHVVMSPNESQSDQSNVEARTGLDTAIVRQRQLSPCPQTSKPETWTNCVGEWRAADDNKYVGEFKDGKYNGLGSFTFASRNKYVGEFKDDKFNGQGTFSFFSGGSYVGEFRNNKFNGHGVLTSPNGSKYAGQFKNDKFSGRGVLTINSRFYSGEFVDGQYQGQVIEDRETGLFLRTADNFSLRETPVGSPATTSTFYPHVLEQPTIATPQLPSDTRTHENTRVLLEEAKTKCAELGFTPSTEKFGKCVLQLSE